MKHKRANGVIPRIDYNLEVIEDQLSFEIYSQDSEFIHNTHDISDHLLRPLKYFCKNKLIIRSEISVHIGQDCLYLLGRSPNGKDNYHVIRYRPGLEDRIMDGLKDWEENYNWINDTGLKLYAQESSLPIKKEYLHWYELATNKPNQLTFTPFGKQCFLLVQTSNRELFLALYDGKNLYDKNGDFINKDMIEFWAYVPEGPVPDEMTSLF